MGDQLTRNDRFATTHWTVVLAARYDWTQAQEALEQLCHTYWFPLYAYVRRKGYSHQDAEDHIQAFFVHVMERQTLAKAQRERGRFRTFLLAALRNFLADARRRASAHKRKGHTIPLDQTAESRFLSEAARQETPEEAFERQWSLQCLADVLDRLRNEYAEAGNVEVFDQLRYGLTGEQKEVTYAQLAERLGKTEAAVKVAAHRLRERYRALLRAQIAETVEAPEDIDDELRCLISALARGCPESM